MKFLSLFAGIGGFDLGLERAGHRCIGQVEVDPYCQRVLAKHWPDVWRHDDVRTLTKDLCDEHCGRIELICGGFPCQDISRAGNGIGIDGERSRLWWEYLRIIREVRPHFVLVENVAALLDRGFERVLGGLAEIGFDAEWSLFPACALGAPHARERVFLIAYSNKIRCWRGRDRMPDPPRHDHWKATQDQRKWEDVERWIRATFQDSDGATADTTPLGVADGIPREVECGFYGNSIVPQVAEYIGRLLPLTVEGF